MSSTIQSSSESVSRIIRTIATEISGQNSQVSSAIALLDGGATVPFISRYRKEVTGGLNDSQLRTLEERLIYLRELENRRSSIIEQINNNGKLDQILLTKLQAADTKSELEDLYLPHKQKRKTKGVMAIEAGLEPLADKLWNNSASIPTEDASDYVNPKHGINDTKAALDGAKYILMERFAVDAVLISRLRTLLQDECWLCAEVVAGKEHEGEKFRDYFDFQERYSTVPSHRALAMFRGRSEGFLTLALKIPDSNGDYSVDKCFSIISSHTGFREQGLPGDEWRREVVTWTWKIKLSTHLESGLFIELREKADTEAIRVFAENLKDLLLAAPAGARTTIGLDPGYRSGVKVAITNSTGKVVDHTTIYPHQPQKQWRKAISDIGTLCEKHQVQLIAIGNGTASRETDQLAAEVIKNSSIAGLTKITVSEAGASVYSASKIAEQEFPELDVTIRGAVSIARRLQDPLAELVKIDPKAIGVGQYQHDVSQSSLARSLNATVEDCVNSVGVDLNTCSAALLTRVAGVTSTIANNIVEYRDQHGAFTRREELNNIPRLGPKAYEQCAAFLRIRQGQNPLDQSSVHPEAYPVVEAIVAHCETDLLKLIGDSERLAQLNPAEFTCDQFGLPTVRDIIRELDKPGRDPRPEFRTAKFAENLETIKDLEENQILEGQVTNVTNFGAFIDIGVHQDGLVHIGSMSHQFIKDPRQVVKTGDIVKVKIMSIDVLRKRIGLSMRLDDIAGEERSRQKRHAQSESKRSRQHSRHSEGESKPLTEKKRTPPKKTAERSKDTIRNAPVPSALALALQQTLGKKVD